jgi:4'-phosphopantetheinyl transferase
VRLAPRAGALVWRARWLVAPEGADGEIAKIGNIDVASLDATALAPPVGEVSVILLRPDFGDRDADLIGPALSPAERSRLADIQHPRARAEFLAGRRLARTILGALCGCEPAAVPIVEGPRGALMLGQEYAKSWHFNLSHTDGLVALAVASSEVGVDVEWRQRPGRTVELADRYFSGPEIAALRDLEAGLQRDRFFDLWTLKEAYIKARGLGLAIPLGAFAFSDLGGAIAITVSPEVSDGPDEAWRFGLADLGEAHRVAVALRT